MKEKIILFIKESFPKPLRALLIIGLIASLALLFLNTFNEKNNINERISKREQEIEGDNQKSVDKQKEIKNSPACQNILKKEELGSKLSFTEKINIEYCKGSFVSFNLPEKDRELQNLLEIKNESFWRLSRAGIVSVVVIFLIILFLIPTLRLLFLKMRWFFRKFFSQTREMTPFQKYSLFLLLLILITLIFAFL